MNNIPERYLNQIPDGMIIEWAGRRKFYEVVEELSDAIWYIIMAAWGFRVLVYFETIEWTWQTQLALFIITVILALPAWLEVERWLSEYHIVCRHSDRDGGVVYKIDGILNPSPQPINIAAGMDISMDEYKNNIFYWLWKTITGDRMQRVSIKTSSNFFLNNRRMDPGYYNAIARVQHSPAPHRVSKDIPFWANVDGLIRARQGQIGDPDLIQSAANRLIRELGGITNDPA